VSDEGTEVTIRARRFAGVWANAARINGSHNEITIDFARLDPVEPRGSVVSLLRPLPHFRTLMDELECVWHDGPGLVAAGTEDS